MQSRVGNGIVYSSEYLSDEEASARLLQSIEGQTLTEPRLIPFKSGMRRKLWNKNCVAIGLSTGFIEPLESTSIHLFMIGVTKLMQLFPFADNDTALRDEYNRLGRNELESIRDFIVLHYKATQRNDSPFWNHCREMAIPHSLQRRIDLFKSHAHAFQGDEELFRIESWTQVMLGQGIKPEDFHHIVKTMPKAELERFLSSIKSNINSNVSSLPSHQDFIKQYCQ